MGKSPYSAYTLWLVRHAEVELPAGLQGQPCCYGATDLPAQPASTLAAAQTLVPRLRHLWHSGAPRWVSGLRRAQQLAWSLDAVVAGSAVRTGGFPALEWHIDARLNEFNFGTWELQPWDRIPKAAVDEWTAQFPHHRFGGAETAEQMVQRVRAALRLTVAQLRSCGTHEAVWVAHAGTARALQVLQANPAGELKSAAEWPLNAPAPGTVCAYVFPAEAFIP